MTVLTSRLSCDESTWVPWETTTLVPRFTARFVQGAKLFPMPPNCPVLQSEAKHPRLGTFASVR